MIIRTVVRANGCFVICCNNKNNEVDAVRCFVWKLLSSGMNDKMPSLAMCDPV